MPTRHSFFPLQRPLNRVLTSCVTESVYQNAAVADSYDSLGGELRSKQVVKWPQSCVSERMFLLIYPL